MPVVLAVSMGVVDNDMAAPLVPIVPEPLVKVAEVEPKTVPAVCVIVPEPVAVIVSEAATVIAVALLAESVKLNIAPVEVPPVATAPESVT